MREDSGAAVKIAPPRQVMCPGGPIRAINLKNVMDEQGARTDTLHQKAVQVCDVLWTMFLPW